MAPSPCSTACALVVDDDANCRELVCGWLRDVCELSAASGGEQALRLLSMQPFDLVLLDNEIPVLSGSATLEKLRSLSNGKTLSVLFLTGSEDESLVRQTLSLRPAGYLLKTASREELRAKVKEILGGAAS